jgi:hypothetical protein
VNRPPSLADALADLLDVRRAQAQHHPRRERSGGRGYRAGQAGRRAWPCRDRRRRADHLLAIKADQLTLLEDLRVLCAARWLAAHLPFNERMFYSESSATVAR